MRDQVFTAEQRVPVPRAEAFAFFSTPELREGTELIYRLRIHGLPVTWRSRIDEWRPNERFVDVQLNGPYAVWHHTHSFHDCGADTLIRDRASSSTGRP